MKKVTFGEGNLGRQRDRITVNTIDGNPQQDNQYDDFSAFDLSTHVLFLLDTELVKANFHRNVFKRYLK